ncbi:MAG: TolC family protein [Imperialibacter sp.]|uniref:TolC family protein n=1 Tax=Imperialibacter sp. TaxID=2038411 RepID=UPI003A84B8E6
MRQLRLFIILALLSVAHLVWSQPADGGWLSLEEFYDLVNKYHPIARQATLLNTRGSLAVNQARGAFDPKLVSDFSRKNFDGKNYYDIWNTYVQVPTLLNVDLKAGYERNKGLYLSPENTVPTDGLYYAGVSVPVGQGLIRNERTIGLQRGKYEALAFENEANNVLNNLFLDANYAYWWWYENHKKREAMQTNLRLIRQRFEGIRQGAISGENATIDSVEMLIQVQQWTNELREAELNLQNSTLLMQNFVWADSLDVVALRPFHEDSTTAPDLDSYLDWALANHPDLKKLNIESSVLELDRKLSSDQLKPVIDVNYNMLFAGQNDLEIANYDNNYKLGVDFVFPLLLRKERAKLKIVKIKQQEYDLKITQKNREVINKIQQSYNKVYTLDDMIDQQRQIQVNYERMLQAELTKFENGESSIFLVNSRENKKLQGQIKLIELEAKYNRSLGELKWATGKLYEEIGGVE